MASISTLLTLRDGMTGPLRSIINANNILINTLLSTHNASRRMIDVTSLRAAQRELSGAEAGINRVEESIRRSSEQQNRLNRNIRAGESAMGGLLGSVKRMAATYLSFQGGRGVLGLSDKMAGATARLGLMVDDGGSVEALEQKIFESAQRSRASYSDTMQSVSKFGLLAGKAFSNNDEIVKFTELMNKNFVIAGASTQEQSSAMYQLNQALGSGRLQGDEYRAIIENAPLLAKSIEDYMINVKGARGSMKDWSADGLLTADVIKTALFNSADLVEKRFEEMPKTFSQVWTDISNQAIQKFSPILDSLNAMANGNNFEVVVSGIINGLSILAGAAVNVFGFIGGIAGVIVQNWSIISPIVMGVAGALVAYKAAMISVTVATTINNLQTGITTAIQSSLTIRVAAANAALSGQTAATFSQTVAQYGLNAALLACPLTWIVLSIIAIITVIYIAVAAVNKFAGTSYSATGIVMGAFAVLGTYIWNTVAFLYNIWAAFANFFLNVFKHPVASVKILFYDLVINVIDYVGKMAAAIEKVINKIPGIKVNMTDGIEGFKKKLEKNSAKIKTEADWVEYAPKMQSKDYVASFSKGYEKGKNIAGKATDAFNGAGTETPNMDQLINDASKTAGNTGKMADSMSMSEEDLKYLRDVAERDIINRFTTAELKVDMTTYANIKNDMDLDGIISGLETKVGDMLVASAEGVHI